MNSRDIRLVSNQAASAYRVTLTLTVEDVRALWSAAAARAMSAPGLTVEDVLDTIGPREDPSIADCIAMLTAPSHIAGCMLEDYEVSESRAGTEMIQIAPEPRRGASWLGDAAVVGIG